MQHVASFSLIASFGGKADIKIMNNLLGSGSTQQTIVSSVSIGLVWNSFDLNLTDQGAITGIFVELRKLPDDIRERIVKLALDEPELSPRELAVPFTDNASRHLYLQRPRQDTSSMDAT